jgi:hypothetical protein
LDTIEQRHQSQPQQPQPQQQPTQHPPPSTRIYPVTEGVNSSKSKVVYQRAFNHFLDYVRIHDLQVLLDFSPKVIKQMIVDYILFLRDEKPGKKLSKSSIKVYLAAILHFFQINNDDFNLTIRNFRIHLPSDDSSPFNEDRPYTREEIEQVLKNGCSDLRCRVVIRLLCSSGLRMGALSRMQKVDLIPVSYPHQGQVNLYKIRVYFVFAVSSFMSSWSNCTTSLDDFICELIPAFCSLCTDPSEYFS